MVPAFTSRDAQLSESKALPASQTSAQTDAIKIGAVGEPQLAPIELRISAPALDVNQLPNTNTVTYAILHGDAADSLTWLATVGVQTGAGGAGAAAAEYRYRPPHNCKAFVALKATNSHNVNASAKSMTLDVMF